MAGSTWEQYRRAEAEVEAIWNDGFRTPREVRRELERRAREPGGGFDIPRENTKTLGNWIRRLARAEDDSIWTSLVTPADAHLVLPVLASVMRATDGRVRQFSRRTARCVAHVRRIAPTCPPYASYQFAQMYARAEAEGRDVLEIDLMVALQPWIPGSAERTALIGDTASPSATTLGALVGLFERAGVEVKAVPRDLGGGEETIDGSR